MSRQRTRWFARVGRMAPVVLLLVLGLTGWGQSPVAARGDATSGVDGNRYTSPTYGYLRVWDDDIWTVADEVVDDDGRDALLLESDVGRASLEGFEDFDGDAEACVDDAAGEIERRDGLSDVESLGRYVRDATPLGRFVYEEGTPPLIVDEVFTYTAVLEDDDEIEVVEYVECSDLRGDLLLRVSIQTPLETFAITLPYLHDLLTTTINPPELVEVSPFTDPVFGWSLAWDEADWYVASAGSTDVDDDLAFGTRLALQQLGGSSVTIEGVPAYGGDPEECLTDRAPREGVNGVEDLRESDLDLPEAPRDAVGALFVFDAGSTEDLHVYLECRTLVEDEAVLVVRWSPLISDYDEALPHFETLIANLDLSGVHPGAGNVVPGLEEEDREIEADLDEVDGSGLRGEAVVTEGSDIVTVEIEVAGEGEIAGYPVYIHEGNCASFNPMPTYALEALDEDGESRTTIAERIGTDLHDVDNHAIVVHRSSQALDRYVACGELRNWN